MRCWFFVDKLIKEIRIESHKVVNKINGKCKFNLSVFVGHTCCNSHPYT